MTKDIDAKELTVGQVRQVLDGLEGVTQFHTIDLLFPDEGVPALAVSLSTGLTMDELDGEIPVSEMRDIIQRVKEKNAFFLSLMKKLIAVGTEAMKEKAIGPR